MFLYIHLWNNIKYIACPNRINNNMTTGSCMAINMLIPFFSIKYYSYFIYFRMIILFWIINCLVIDLFLLKKPLK